MRLRPWILFARTAALGLALAAGFSGRAQTPAATPPPIGATLAQLRRTPRDPLLLQRLREAVTAAPADEQVPLGLAVYALGSLVQDRLVDAESARKVLLTRFPDSAEAKTVTNWDGLFRPCAWCQGNGTRRGEICERCHGTRKCAACTGAGNVSLMGRRKAPCTACNGTGRCPACGGSGRKDVPCPRCNATGRVPVPDRAFRLYRAVLRAEVE